MWKPSSTVTASPMRTVLSGLFLVGRADVEPQVLHLRHLLPLLLGEQVDRLSGDDAEDRPVGGPDGHPLADQHLRVPAADGLDIEEAVVVDVLDDQPDLVAVAGQHHPQRGVGVLDHDHVAVQVGADLVGEVLDVIADEPLQRALIARRAGRFQERLRRNRGRSGSTAASLLDSGVIEVRNPSSIARLQRFRKRLGLTIERRAGVELGGIFEEAP